MPSRPANVSLIHRRCSGPSAARGREDNQSAEPHPLTFCSMSELRFETPHPSPFVYLALILDCYCRMIVGWQRATHLSTELVRDALEMANGLRRPARG